MAKASERVSNRWLKREDVGAGKLLTVKEVFEDTIGVEGMPGKNVLITTFNETDKCLILNDTNLQSLAVIFDLDDTDDWPNNSAICYWDPNVRFGSQLVGGIRFKPAKSMASPSVTADTNGKDEAKANVKKGKSKSVPF